MTSEAVYRALLRLHPKPFRDEFGDDMVQAFKDLRRHQGRSRIVTWARVINDLVVSAIYERKEWVMSKKASYSLAAGAVATAVIYTGVLVGVGGSVKNAFIVFGIVLALSLVLVGISAAIGYKVKAPTENATSLRHNWWVPASMLIGLAYMFIGLRPLVEDPDSINVLQMLPSLGFAALMVFGLVMRYRSSGNIGDWAILVASLPALPFVWFPVIPLVGLVSIVGALSDVFAKRKHAQPTPAN